MHFERNAGRALARGGVMEISRWWRAAKPPENRTPREIALKGP